MVEKESNILELNFSGNGISPDTVKPSEIANQIVNFEETLLHVIKDKYPEINTEEILFSLDRIEDNSLDIIFKPLMAVAIVLNSYNLVSESINSNDFSILPIESVKSLNRIAKFTKKHDCIATFKLDNNNMSSITKDTIIEKVDLGVFKGETTLYGKLTDIGGEKPNLHLKLNDKENIIIDITEEDAQKLAVNLYQFIGLKGSAVWDAETYKVIKFKFNDIVPYKGGNTFNAISDIKNNISSGVWDKYNTESEINEALFRK